MENASKALLIGAGMLIALLVLSALVMMFNSLGLFQSTSNKSKASEQIAEFNMEFEAYNREDVLGIELVSLCNKINDYNAKYQEDEYTKITIIFTKNNFSLPKNGLHFPAVRSFLYCK